MGIVDKIKDFLRNAQRIFRVARRPEFKEVRLIARVSGIGILIVGGLAYLIQILGNLVNGFFLPAQETEGGFIINAILLLFDAHVLEIFVQSLLNPYLLLVPIALLLLSI